MKNSHSAISRRSVMAGAFAGLGLTAFAAEQKAGKDAPVARKDPLKITRLETILVKPRWLFLKVHTNAGIVGLGEPVVEGRALTVAEAVKEIAPYLVGKDPRQVVHHWQAIYRHAFYRGGPILTSALSGIDQALWDIKGKVLGVPVYELLGGPTRNRIRVYAHAQHAGRAEGEDQAGIHGHQDAASPSGDRRVTWRRLPKSTTPLSSSASCARPPGTTSTSPSIFTAPSAPHWRKCSSRRWSRYHPMFIEEPVNCQEHDIMAEIARGTHLPIATGERVFTKWGFREVLEKKAATILQPDLCHAGGITEVRLIAGMAEAYYATMAPHNPLGPISLAASCTPAASEIGPSGLCGAMAA